MIAQYRSQIIKHLKEIAMPKNPEPPKQTPPTSDIKEIIQAALEAAKKGIQTIIELPKPPKPK